MQSKPAVINKREDILQDFDRRGLSIRAWAIANDVNPVIAAHVLAGRCKGRFGEAHRAAVLLGLKVGNADRGIPAAALKVGS